MKKMMFSLLAMLMFCSTAFAQGCCKKDGEKKDVCKSDFAQKRTEQMVERYGLNSDQKAKLLAVNTAFFEKYGKKCNGCPTKDQAKKDCCENKQETKQCSCNNKQETKQCCCNKEQETKQCSCNNKQEAKQCCCNKKECSKETPGNNKCNQSICEKENNKEQIKADVAKYKSDLKQIFTKEQYEKYENDIKERQEHLKAAMEKRQAE